MLRRMQWVPSTPVMKLIEGARGRTKGGVAATGLLDDLDAGNGFQ